MSKEAPAPPENWTPKAVSNPTPLSIVAQFASDPNFDVEKLDRLLKMQERISLHQAEKDWSDAMCKVQAEVNVVVRDGANEQTKSAYASHDNINRVVKPIYTKHGFAISFAEDECKIPEWKRTVADVRHIGGHTVRYHIDLPLDGVGAKGNAIGAMNRVQAAVSTGTYGQRVLLCRILNLTMADTDQDGQSQQGFITPEQVAELNELLLQTGGAVKLDKFLAWASCESLDKMLVKNFQTAVKFLRGKKASPEVAEWSAWLASDPTIDAVNAKLPEIKAMPDGQRQAVWSIVETTLAKHGVVFDKALKKFVVKDVL